MNVITDKYFKRTASHCPANTCNISPEAPSPETLSKI